jgi:hypothetical protein
MIGVVVEADGESISAAEAADANDPTVGEGTPGTAPEHDLAAELPVYQRHPVRMAGAVQGIVGGAALLSLGVPRRVAVPVGAGLYLVSAVVARRVTPLACPRDAQGDPLMP